MLSENLKLLSGGPCVKCGVANRSGMCDHTTNEFVCIECAIQRQISAAMGIPQEMMTSRNTTIENYRRLYLNEIPDRSLPSRRDLQRCIDAGQRPQELARELGVKTNRLYAILRGEEE